MFDFIRKAEYFGWLEDFAGVRSTYESASASNLKDIQDHYVLSRLANADRSRILEIGGADCRVLRTLTGSNECWNAEKFEGAGLGPKRVICTPGVRNAFVYLGDFSAELPEAYFDIVFSISVVEHVETESLPAFFQDIARILKPGGRTLHAIDAYLFDSDRFSDPLAAYTRRRLEAYSQVTTHTGGMLVPVAPANVSTEPGFRCDYATNSDREMYAWNRYAPKLSAVRAISQSCSLKCEWEKQSTASTYCARTELPTESKGK